MRFYVILYVKGTRVDLELKNDNTIIGQRLRAIREYRKLNQEYVAQVLGVERATYTRYESGKIAVSAADLKRLAEYYKIPIAYFYNDDDIEGPVINDYYNGLSAGKKAVADEVIRSLWLQDQREETTHGRKAE